MLSRPVSSRPCFCVKCGFQLYGQRAAPGTGPSRSELELPVPPQPAHAVLLKNIDHLLLRLPETDQVGLERIARDEFNKTYVERPEGSLTLHDGTPCRFQAHRYQHAFRDTLGRGEPGTLRKGNFAPARIRRIPWIELIVTGQVARTSCFHIEAGKEPSWHYDRRLYIFETFVVWTGILDPRVGLEYSSSYIVDNVNTLRKYSK